MLTTNLLRVSFLFEMFDKNLLDFPNIIKPFLLQFNIFNFALL